jgi:hypothetical protein
MKIILSLIISFFLIFVSSISYANDVTLDNDNWYKSSAPASNDFTLEAIFTINDVSKAYQAIAYAGNFSNGVGIGAASGALVVCSIILQEQLQPAYLLFKELNIVLL